MGKIKAGIIEERKVPVDSRSPLSPSQLKIVKNQYPEVEFVVQKSNSRCFADSEFEKVGVELVDSVEDCDILFGVKEVPIENLLPKKTYFFFSHTIKKQPYNRDLLRKILDQKIQLVDYECLVNEKNIRIIAFGRWAGIVGTYNALWTYGRKYKLFELKRAHECHDFQELLQQLEKITLPPIKIIITGNGRVANGGLEILRALKIKQVEPAPFFYQSFDQPVYTQMDVNSYYRHKGGNPFHFDHFFTNPADYISDFVPFTHKADVLINAVFWHPQAPRLFSLEDMKHPGFSIRVIADITCDMDGSIPSTIRATTIDKPVYDFHSLQGELPAFSNENVVSVMSIDNLPNELPRDSSEEFGNQLMNNVLPSLFGKDDSRIIEKATIAKNGKLSKRFEYLSDYVKVN